MAFINKCTVPSFPVIVLCYFELIVKCTLLFCTYVILAFEHNFRFEIITNVILFKLLICFHGRNQIRTLSTNYVSNPNITIVNLCKYSYFIKVIQWKNIKLLKRVVPALTSIYIRYCQCVQINYAYLLLKYSWFAASIHYVNDCLISATFLWLVIKIDDVVGIHINKIVFRIFNFINWKCYLVPPYIQVMDNEWTEHFALRKHGVFCNFVMRNWLAWASHWISEFVN